MTYQDALLSNYESYLEFEFPIVQTDAHLSELANDIDEREDRLKGFPYYVILELSYAELDFTNRWCWETFGNIQGKCEESSSGYPACQIKFQHSHWGNWMCNWFVKTGYNFGYCEWYFVNEEMKNQFLENVPNNQWGELYPDPC